jgi:hypothetical protein
MKVAPHSAAGSKPNIGRATGLSGSHHFVGEREQDGLQFGVGLDRDAAALAPDS